MFSAAQRLAECLRHGKALFSERTEARVIAPRRSFTPTVLLCFVFALVFAGGARANHPDNDGCPDTEVNGGQSFEPILSLKSNGAIVTDDLIFTPYTAVWLDALATAFGSCTQYWFDPAKGQCVLGTHQERVVVNVKRYADYITDTLNGGYVIGDTGAVTETGGTALGHHVFDTRDTTKTSPRRSISLQRGTHIVTMWDNIWQTPCQLPPKQLVRRFKLQTHYASIDKDLGCSGNGIGNPCDPITGNKYQREVDYSGPVMPFVRHYNSKFTMEIGLGAGWTSNYHKRIEKYVDGTRRARGEDGRSQPFTSSGGGWISDADSKAMLTEDATGYTLTLPTGQVERYDASGRILQETDVAGKTTVFTYDAAGRVSTVTGPFGNSLSFAYNQDDRISAVTDPAGGQILYAYDSIGNLTSATYPDDKSRIYHYEHTSLKHHLTGITDENGNRFATYAYDSYSGRAISTQHAGGADKFSFVYNTNATTVTDALATTRVYGLQSILGAGKITSISQPCADCAASSTYDSNGNLASRKDFNGNLTCYTNDTTRNLETKRVEGLSGTACPGTAGAATRTINTEWHPTWQLPARIAQPNRITTYSYDTHANLISKSIQATTDSDGSLGLNATASGSPRAWTYTHTYHPTITGFITQTVADGPRTDVSDTRTFAYDSSNGSLASITNALGQVTTFSNFDAHGRPQRVTDPNGLITDLTYDLRGRLIGRTVGGELAAYQYDGVGQLTKITLPDGSYLIYTYDAAHRLTHIQDNLGNKIIYTLDAIGNRTQEQVFDPSNTLAQTRNRVFNSLNRLYRELGALSQITEYAYDNQGNVTSVKNPLNHVTTNQFDALNRLKQVTDPSPISGVTQYAYNGQDQLIQVTDPRGLATGYTIDGLGNLSQQSSPDSGNTVNTYDAAGNLATQTDARGQQTSYTYDALNRITLITFHDGSKQEYAYDAGTYGIGRLTGITERDPANQITAQTAYAYDAHGRILTDARTLAGITYTTAYRYDPSGRRDRITYPSGRTVDFAFDSLGRVSSVSTTPPSGAAQTLASGITYQPFGGLKSFTFGNAQTYARTYDLDGRISSYTLGGTQYSLGYDAASRITLVTEAANPPNTNTYDYDALDRLTSAILPLTSYGYTYDPVGNRLTRTAGSSTDTYTYSSTSNRLADLTPPSGPVRTFGFDPNGSTTADGNNTYAYDVRGRMTSSTSSLGTTTYQVNALGQRIRKTSSLGDSVFHYDDKGHLMAESTAAGATVREYVWLGDTPLAVASSATVHYVHIDHLNTPRLVANAAGQTVWLWHQGEPFGNSVPDENPSGLGAFDLPLRLPGQYFDRETNLHYNYYRDYDASIGTYKESDLIGLAGGLNTYVYVAGNPLSLVDVRGLFPDHDRERPEQRAQRERPENARPNNAKGPSKEEAEKWGCYQICVPREYEGKTKKVALMCAALTVIFTYGGFQGGGPAGAYAGFGMGMGLTAGTAAANMYEVDRLCREECGLPKNSWF